MKKNLRIVSAAAAALLAVAPVAATAVATPATTVFAADQTNQPVPVPPVNTTVTESKLDSTAEDAATNYLKAHPLKDNNSLSGGSITQGDFDADSIKIDTSKVTTKATSKNVTKNNDKITSAFVNVAYQNPVTVTVKVNGANAEQTAKGNVSLELGPSWGQQVYSTGDNSTSPRKLTFVSFNKDTNEATYSFNLPTATIQFNNAVADKTDTSSENIVTDGNKIFNSIFAADPNTDVNINATASTDEKGHKVNWGSVLNGQIVYTDAKGASHTALLHGDTNTVVTNDATGQVVTDLQAGVLYRANFNKVTINLGSSAAGSKVKFVLPETAGFVNHDKNYGNVQTVTVDSNGIADLGTVYAKFYAYNPTDLQEVHFYSEKTGNQVTSGNITLHAVNGKLNLYSFFHAMKKEYKASQLDNGKSSTYAKHDMLPVAIQNDLRDQLKKQNITVDDNGNFTAPATFTVNMTAKSIYNGATATLPVTVTVDNVTPTAANETTKNVTIMHIATIYDKNGKATHEPALRAYNSVSVVSDPVNLKDEKGNDAGKFYKLAGKDEYIKVGNVDGTSRSLKHNSYVYKSTGKRNGKKVLKKGSSVTTYGKSFMIAGHQMYRIGKNQYVKKANF